MLTQIWEFKGVKHRFTFFDGGSEKDYEPYTQSYAICFRDDGKIIIGKKPVGFDHWLIAGGTREKGEDCIKTLKREADEELSLEIIKYKFIGAQKVEYLNIKKKPHYQLRYVAIVKEKKLKPDPDCGMMWEKKIIKPKDFLKYLKWGNIGEHLVKESVNWFEKEKKKKV